MTDTPETDLAVRGSNGQWSFGLRDLCRSLERQRDAYAETLRQIATSAVCGGIVRERHPELGNSDQQPPRAEKDA